MERATLKKILNRLGAVILLVSFLSQQYIFETWNGRLGEIQGAQDIFLTYQSNNSIFNALNSIVPPDQIDNLRAIQIQNYKFGLLRLREALSGESAEGLEEKIDTRHGELIRLGVKSLDLRLQAELEIIQVEFRKEEQIIEENKGRAELLYSTLYVAGTVMVILGEWVSEIRKRRIKEGSGSSLDL